MQTFYKAPGESVFEFACQVHSRTATEKQFKKMMEANSIPCCTIPARFNSGVGRMEFSNQIEEECSFLGEPMDYYMHWSPIDVTIYFATEEMAALFKLSHSSI